MNKLFEKHSLNLGRMISSSKTLYRMNNPKSEPIFNANVFSDEGKIWYGDLEMTTDSSLLQKISDESNKTIYVLREFDGRFENENAPIEQVIAKSTHIFHPND